jgi:hypothetical protein
MESAMLEIRQTPDIGRGVFAVTHIAKGTKLVECAGWLAKSDALQDNWRVMQVGHDLWLCSLGDSLDDCINHSCEPNAGFVHGDAVLYALRDIEAGEQITWDYSTSLAEAGWSLDCLCGSARCRKVVRSWPELTHDERERLRGIALAYLRSDGNVMGDDRQSGSAVMPVFGGFLGGGAP